MAALANQVQADPDELDFDFIMLDVMAEGGILAHDMMIGEAWLPQAHDTASMGWLADAYQLHHLDTTHIAPRLVVEHPGYFRQLNEVLVFQLKRPFEEYISLQGAERRTFGVLIKINIDAQLAAGIILELNAARSSVELYIAENTSDKLVFAVQAESFNAATGDLTLNLTATSEEFMLLAAAIRARHHKLVRQGIVQFDLHFGAGVMQFRSSFIWRSLATCKKLPGGEFTLTVV
jgi:hypothetical protein